MYQNVGRKGVPVLSSIKFIFLSFRAKIFMSSRYRHHRNDIQSFVVFLHTVYNFVQRTRLSDVVCLLFSIFHLTFCSIYFIILFSFLILCALCRVILCMFRITVMRYGLMDGTPSATKQRKSTTMSVNSKPMICVYVFLYFLHCFSIRICNAVSVVD